MRIGFAPRTDRQIDTLAYPRHQLRRQLGIVGAVAIDHHMDVGIDGQQRAGQDASLAGTHKALHHLRHRRALAQTGHQHRNAQVTPGVVGHGAAVGVLGGSFGCRASRSVHPRAA